jgi:hypothetical protein
MDILTRIALGSLTHDVSGAVLAVLAVEAVLLAGLVLVNVALLVPALRDWRRGREGRRRGGRPGCGTTT